MTPEQQTAATDNALVEALEAWGPLIAGGYECPAAGQRVHEAAERIKSLLAEVRALEHHRSMTADCMAVLLTKKNEAEAEIAALTRSFTDVSTQYLKALDEVAASKADRQRMREALEKLMKHMRLMQSQCAQYVEPTGYTAFDRKRIAFSTDREAKDSLFIGDMIWLLDGPEQRAVDALARQALNPASKEANDG